MRVSVLGGTLGASLIALLAGVSCSSFEGEPDASDAATTPLSEAGAGDAPDVLDADPPDAALLEDAGPDLDATPVVDAGECAGRCPPPDTTCRVGGLCGVDGEPGCANPVAVATAGGFFRGQICATQAPYAACGETRRLDAFAIPGGITKARLIRKSGSLAYSVGSTCPPGACTPLLNLGETVVTVKVGDTLVLLTPGAPCATYDVEFLP